MLLSIFIFVYYPFRVTKTDICDVCTEIKNKIDMLTAAGNLGTVPNLRNTLHAHKTEARHRQNLLHDAVKEGPTMHPDTNKTRYICTGKVFSFF